jgi:hypothetical protein
VQHHLAFLGEMAGTVQRVEQDGFSIGIPAMTRATLSFGNGPGPDARALKGRSER